MKDQSCKTSRWRILKAQLNNLAAQDFSKKMTESKEPLLIDVRTEQEFASGHLNSAININYLSEDFWDQIEQLDTDRDIFVYCRTGRRSIRACTLMKNGGFDNDRLFNMDGGYALWLEMMK